MHNFKAIILAGGSGERFWPLSTPEKPKQFLRVFGGESLIRQSVSRLKGLVCPEDVFVITSKALVAATRKELPEIPKANIIGEPMRRDTGAAVALGVGVASCAALTSGEDTASPLTRDVILGFFPSDQLVAKPVAFRKAVGEAIKRAKAKDAIVTLGIKPTFPATGYGYVDPKSGRFVEKPNVAKAKAYLKKGYLWNAGMFIASAATFRGAFAAHAPELEPLFSPGAVRRLARIYPALPKISFDYAVMEKYPAVAVVPGDFGWDDVGSYGAFDRYFPHDAAGNVREGPCTVVQSEGNVCVARAARISLLGVKNLVVVTTGDYVLVADKSCLNDMKKVVKKVEGLEKV